MVIVFLHDILFCVRIRLLRKVFLFMANNKWLLTQTMSLGYCRDTFKAGSVIVELEDSLMINGKEYKDNRDLDILKRQMLKNPNNPWMIPYTEEDEQRLLSTGKTDTVVRKRPPTDHSMPIISSDDDLIDEIDVSNTQVSVINERKRQMERDAAKNGKLEVIPDQEDVETHLKRIAGLSDAASIAERVALKSGGIQKMNVVRDDSLGAQYDSKQNPALNAGQVIPAKHHVAVEQKPLEEKLDERKFTVESVVETVLDKYFGNVGVIGEIPKLLDSLDEKLKLFESIAEKIKLIDEIAEKIKALDQIKILLEKYDTLKALFEELKSKVDVASSYTDSSNESVSSDESAVVESETVIEDDAASDSSVENEAVVEETTDEVKVNSTITTSTSKKKKGKPGRKQKH